MMSQVTIVMIQCSMMLNNNPVKPHCNLIVLECLFFQQKKNLQKIFGKVFYFI